jgi:hypothetical protein
MRREAGKIVAVVVAGLMTTAIGGYAVAATVDSALASPARCGPTSPPVSPPHEGWSGYRPPPKTPPCPISPPISRLLSPPMSPPVSPPMSPPVTRPCPPTTRPTPPTTRTPPRPPRPRY